MADAGTVGDSERLDVAIVGFGPVGALLANALGLFGLRTAVFERGSEVFELPRAVHLDFEIMRCFQAVGLAEAILPWTIPTRGIEFVNSRGERYFGTVERGAAPAPTPFGWERGYMFYQPDLERELRRGVERFANVRVKLRHDVESIETSNDAVELRVRDLDSGVLRSEQASFVVGCDGSHSTTRRALGGRLESLGYDRQWLVVDVFLQRDVELPGMSQQICDPDRPTTFIYSARGHRRWEFLLLPGESADEMQQPETVRRLLARWLGPKDAQIVRASVYEFHGVVATPWRSGRLLIAGDAAHQMPPFQGQGLCAGIRDVANLGWKLAWVLEGRAPAALLDSYEAERSAHARAVVDSSIRVGRVIEELAASEARGEAFRDDALEGNATRRAGWMPKLRSGLMSEDAQAPDEPAGELFVQPRVRLRGGPEQRLDDVLGSHFALICPEKWAKQLSRSARATLRRIDARLFERASLQDLDGWLDRWLDADSAVVVRPDRYVLGVAKDPAALDAQLETLAERLGIAS